MKRILTAGIHLINKFSFDSMQCGKFFFIIITRFPVATFQFPQCHQNAVGSFAGHESSIYNHRMLGLMSVIPKLCNKHIWLNDYYYYDDDDIKTCP